MNTILGLIIVFVVLDFAIGYLLSRLNESWMGKPIPEVLKGIYDDEKYKKQQSYSMENRRLGRIEDSVETLVTLALLVFGVFGWFDGVCRTITSSTEWQMVIFVCAITLAVTLLALPFSYYDTFVIEERYGFNKTTRKTFWLDTLKSTLLSFVLTVLILLLVYWLYDSIGESFWIWATVAIAAFVVIMNLFYSNLIVPLFNKQTPLEEGELRTEIERAAREAKFKIKNIYLIDGSKRSTKANAYFTGFGAKKRIVLYDTLKDQMTTREIVAVLMHEVGHYRHRDTLKTMAMSIVTMTVYMYVFSLLVGNPKLSLAMGGEEPSFMLALMAFGLLLSPISLLLSPLTNTISRRAEYRADAFAAEQGFGKELVEALKKLSSHALSNLTPHPFVVWYSHNHPTLAQRVTAINELTDSQQ